MDITHDLVVRLRRQRLLRHSRQKESAATRRLTTDDQGKLGSFFDNSFIAADMGTDGSMEFKIARVEDFVTWVSTTRSTQCPPRDRHRRRAPVQAATGLRFDNSAILTLSITIRSPLSAQNMPAALLTCVLYSG